jgi:hypothetical protein
VVLALGRENPATSALRSWVIKKARKGTVLPEALMAEPLGPVRAFIPAAEGKLKVCQRPGNPT